MIGYIILIFDMQIMMEAQNCIKEIISYCSAKRMKESYQLLVFRQ